MLHENAHLLAKMHTMAITDSLTGIHNRHYFNEAFQRAIERARRHTRPLTVMLIDVDHFKEINDNLGHLQGDEVLKVFAQVLRSNLRSNDLVARFGGDEFVILLPDTDLPNSQVIAERLLLAIAGIAVGPAHLGVSIGLSEYQPGYTPEKLIERLTGTFTVRNVGS